MKTGGQIDIPTAIEFGYCRVGIEETRKFTITNQPGVTSKFSIFSEIFTFNPRQGKRCAYHSIRNSSSRSKGRGDSLLYSS